MLQYSKSKNHGNLPWFLLKMTKAENSGFELWLGQIEDSGDFRDKKGCAFA